MNERNGLDARDRRMVFLSPGWDTKRARPSEPVDVTKNRFSLLAAVIVGGVLAYLGARSHLIWNLRTLNPHTYVGVWFGFGLATTLALFIPIRIAAHFLWRDGKVGTKLSDEHRHTVGDDRSS